MAVDLRRLLSGGLEPLFHEWIRTDRLPDETFIDVADYSHLKDGPGVVLVAHRSATASTPLPEGWG
jgi:hypothetical protein